MYSSYICESKPNFIEDFSWNISLPRRKDWEIEKVRFCHTRSRPWPWPEGQRPTQKDIAYWIRAWENNSISFFKWFATRNQRLSIYGLQKDSLDWIHRRWRLLLQQPYNRQFAYWSLQHFHSNTQVVRRSTFEHFEPITQSLLLRRPFISPFCEKNIFAYSLPDSLITATSRISQDKFHFLFFASWRYVPFIVTSGF